MKARFCAVALAAVLGTACDFSPTGPAAPSPQATARLSITCVATVSTGTVRCAEETPGGMAGTNAVIVGRQGVYVLLENDNIVVDASSFSTDVVLTNLAAQVLGTSDQITDTGIRVFFNEGPTVVGGSGTVQVANATGIGTFTAAAQAYFEYPGLLGTFETTDPMTWTFALTGDVPSFTFGVYVEAAIPHENSLLRFQLDQNSSEWYNGVWAASATEAFAAGEFGVVSRRLGPRAWVSEYPTDASLFGIWGSSSTDVFAVGEAGTIVHWDGTAWSIMDSGLDPCGCDMLFAVAGSGPNDVWAGGVDGVLTHYDGTSWTVADPLPVVIIGSMWAAAPNDVYALASTGFGTILYHYDGAAWTAIDPGVPLGHTATSVWGLTANEVYVTHTNGMRRFNGTSWSNVSGLGSCPYYDGGATSSSDIFLIKDCGIEHFDGSSWTDMNSGWSPYDLSIADSESLFVVTYDGYIIRGRR